MKSENKILVIDEFYNKYKNLNETKKNDFSRLCNKLLNDNFIYGQKKEDREDYYDVLTMKSEIEDYFSLIGFDLIQVDTYKIFYIQTNIDRNRYHLKKFDTVVLLVLRLLYYKGSLNVNESTNIQTTVEKLKDEINQTGIFQTAISVKNYEDSFRLLKRYKIINYDFTKISEDNVITIYPTILYIVKSESIDMLKEKITTYINNRGDVNEDEEN